MDQPLRTWLIIVIAVIVVAGGRGLAHHRNLAPLFAFRLKAPGPRSEPTFGGRNRRASKGVAWEAFPARPPPTPRPLRTAARCRAIGLTGGPALGKRRRRDSPVGGASSAGPPTLLSTLRYLRSTS
jgi:hypothetical protein